MDSQRRLEEIFSHFPGIGPRQAKRFVYYILSRSNSTIKEFIDLLQEVKNNTAECSSCRRFFIENRSSKKSACPICTDMSRDTSTLMVLARDSDFESVEKSGAFKGLYFILGGTVPILDKEPEKRIRLEKLLQNISANKNLKEIILSMNTTPEGEHTGDIIREAIANLPIAQKIKISVLGRGLSTGTELEYVDSETIKNALQNRH